MTSPVMKEVKLGFQSSPQQNREKHQSDMELRERLRLFVFCLIGLYQCSKLLESVETITIRVLDFTDVTLVSDDTNSFT